MTLREVEIYIPNVEYRTCFYSSQESGETWWPSKCHEWTFGLKSGYQQVREVLKVHTCLPSAVGVSNISEIWVWYKVHFQFGGEARCFFRWTSVFLYFRLKNTWRVNAASIYYVDILITTNESHVSELSSGKELLWIIFPLLLKVLFRRISLFPSILQTCAFGIPILLARAPIWLRIGSPMGPHFDKKVGPHGTCLQC